MKHYAIVNHGSIIGPKLSIDHVTVYGSTVKFLCQEAYWFTGKGESIAEEMNSAYKKAFNRLKKLLGEDQKNGITSEQVNPIDGWGVEFLSATHNVFGIREILSK